MIIKKWLCRFGIWRGVVVGLAMTMVMVGIVCLPGPVANARVYPMVTIESNGLALWDDQGLPTGTHEWLFAKQKRGFGEMPREAQPLARKWKQMSPEEQKRYQKRYQKLQKMSPTERKRYEKWHQQWKKLSPAERDQLRQKLKRRKDLSPQEVDTIRRRFNN